MTDKLQTREQMLADVTTSEQQAVPVAQSPASIWLSPICDETADHGEGRTWASPAPDAECEDCGLPWVEYVRADLAPVFYATQTREAELVAALEAQMEAWDADENLPSSIARERGLVWLEGWFDISAALNARGGA